MAIEGKVTLNIIRVIFSLNHALNMMPLRVSHKESGIRLEVQQQPPLLKYSIWSLQAALFANKLVCLLLRNITCETSAYYVLHAIMLIQIAGGLSVLVSVVVKSEEAKTYFNCVHKLAQQASMAPIFGLAERK